MSLVSDIAFWVVVAYGLVEGAIAALGVGRAAVAAFREWRASRSKLDRVDLLDIVIDPAIVLYIAGSLVLLTSLGHGRIAGWLLGVGFLVWNVFGLVAERRLARRLAEERSR